MKGGRRRSTVGLAPMGAAGLVWLCSLPLVSWLLVPRLGWAAAAAAALALLLFVGGLCWGLCTANDTRTGPRSTG
jgi:hypothetical protein